MSATIRPSHLGLCVTDLTVSLRFWVDGLGFQPGERYELDSEMLPALHRALEVAGPVAVTSQFVRRDGWAIELLEYATPPVSGHASASRGQVGLTHLAFHVDDLATAVDHLVAHGGTVVEGTRADVGIPVVFLADPDGVRVELMEMPVRS
jgi:lactoylglutathione lyase